MKKYIIPIIALLMIALSYDSVAQCTPNGQQYRAIAATKADTAAVGLSWYFGTNGTGITGSYDTAVYQCSAVVFATKAGGSCRLPITPTMERELAVKADNKFKALKTLVDYQTTTINGKASTSTLLDSLEAIRNNYNYANRRTDTVKQTISYINNTALPSKMAKSDTAQFAEGIRNSIPTPPPSNWLFTGNSNTDENSFLGTTNNADVVFKRNGITAMTFRENRAISIGENNAVGIGAISIGTLSGTGGDNAVAIGDHSTSNENSTAIGRDSYAAGLNSTAIGYAANSLGTESLALGFGNLSIGHNSITVGSRLKSNAVNCVTIGTFNDRGDTPDSEIKDPTDRLFQIGNGINSEEGGSNAVTILRNGNMSVGNDYAPTEKLQVGGRIKAQNLRLTAIPVYATDMIAGSDGLVAGDVYRTAGGVLMIKL